MRDNRASNCWSHQRILATRGINSLLFPALIQVAREIAPSPPVTLFGSALALQLAQDTHGFQDHRTGVSHILQGHMYFPDAKQGSRKIGSILGMLRIYSEQFFRDVASLLKSLERRGISFQIGQNSCLPIQDKLDAVPKTNVGWIRG